jgi:hypothetical protein
MEPQFLEPATLRLPWVGMPASSLNCFARVTQIICACYADHLRVLRDVRELELFKHLRSELFAQSAVQMPACR